MQRHKLRSGIAKDASSQNDLDPVTFAEQRAEHGSDRNLLRKTQRNADTVRFFRDHAVQHHLEKRVQLAAPIELPAQAGKSLRIHLDEAQQKVGIHFVMIGSAVELGIVPTAKHLGDVGKSNFGESPFGEILGTEEFTAMQRFQQDVEGPQVQIHDFDAPTGQFAFDVGLQNGSAQRRGGRHGQGRANNNQGFLDRHTGFPTIMTRTAFDVDTRTLLGSAFLTGEMY